VITFFSRPGRVFVFYITSNPEVPGDLLGFPRCGFVAHGGADVWGEG